MAEQGSNRNITINGKFTLNNKHPEYGFIQFSADVFAVSSVELKFFPDNGQISGYDGTKAFTQTFSCT